MRETILFYESLLGFKGTSNFPHFVSLTREGIEIMFVVPQDESEYRNQDENGAVLQKPLLRSVMNKVKVKYPLQDREYRMRDFSILDNNGYELVFGEDISNKTF